MAGGPAFQEQRRISSWKILVPVVAVVTALIASGLYLRSRSKAKLTDKDTIVLADFTNTTGDPVFDDTLKQALSVQLEQSPFLNILSNQKINETLKLMSRKPGATTGSRRVPKDNRPSRPRRE